jgi:chromosome segregation ATPase
MYSATPSKKYFSFFFTFFTEKPQQTPNYIVGKERQRTLLSDTILTGGRWMDNETKILTILETLVGEVGDLKKDLTQHLDRLEQRMGALEQSVAGLDQRIGALEQRVDGLDQRIGTLEQRVDGLDQRMDGLEQSMNGIAERMLGLMVAQKWLSNDFNGLWRKQEQFAERLELRMDRLEDGQEKTHEELEKLNDRVSRIESNCLLQCV